MIEIPENIAALVTYKPGKRAEEIREQYGLERIAKLSSNENPRGPAPKAIEAGMQALRGVNRYPDANSSDLRAALAKRLEAQPRNIVLGNGSESLLLNILRAFMEPGHEVLTSEHTFVAFYIMARACRVPLRLISMRSGRRYDLDAIADAIGPRTKVLYLANPNNPTGTIFTAREFDRFMQRVPSSILVVLDQAYFDYAVSLTDEYPRPRFSDYSNLLVLRTFSKAYGLAGMRIGYGVGAASIIRPLYQVKLTFEPSRTAQAAALGALEDEAYLEDSLRENRQGLDRLRSACEGLEVRCCDSFTNFLTVELGSKERAEAVNQGLLRRGVITRPLKGWGIPEALRITIGTPEEVEMCIAALTETLS